MQIRVLGRVEVRDDDGVPVVVGQWKVRQLVAVLALADGPIPSARLRAVLWGDTRSSRNAVSALTTTLSRLRRVLPDGRLVREEGGFRLVVDAERDYLDVREFRELVATARAVREAYPERSAELLRRAVGLWRDPQLPDLPDTPSMAEELRLERRRSRPEIESMFTGLELTAPLDDPGNWHTDQALPPTSMAALASVAFRT